MPLRSISECSHAIISNSAGGTISVIPAITDQAVNIYRMLVTITGAVALTIQDTGGTNLSQPFTFPVNGGAIVLDQQFNGDPWFAAARGLGIQFSASTAVQINADVWYQQAVSVTG